MVLEVERRDRHHSQMSCLGIPRMVGTTSERVDAFSGRGQEGRDGGKQEAVLLVLSFAVLTAFRGKNSLFIDQHRRKSPVSNDQPLPSHDNSMPRNDP